MGEKYYDGYSLNTFRYERRYIYDGMQMIAEYSVSGSTLSRVKSYYWGLDITHTPGGAGGIGGLILIDDAASGKSYFPGYDGRGNLTLLLDTADVSLDAVFEYSPNGRTWRASGPAAALTPFRYQTKWSLDHAPKQGEHWTIDQYDYGLRIYDAQMGRFISRDPIGEAGGMNLYAAFGNDPVNKWDYLGLDTYDEAMRRKEEEIAKANCAAQTPRGDYAWIGGQCVFMGDPDPDDDLFYIEYVTADPWTPEEERRYQQQFQDDISMLMNRGSGYDPSLVDSIGIPDAPSLNVMDLIPKGNSVPLEWLEKLCGSKEGRDTVASFADGTYDLYSNQDIFTGALETYGGLNGSAIGRNDIIINLNPNNSIIKNTMMQKGRFAYTGDQNDEIIFAILAEVGDYKFPGTSLRNEANAREWAHGMMRKMKLPSFYPDRNNYGGNGLTIRGLIEANIRGTVSSGEAAAGVLSVSGYKQVGIQQSAFDNSMKYVGWDCSRIK